MIGHQVEIIQLIGYHDEAVASDKEPNNHFGQTRSVQTCWTDAARELSSSEHYKRPMCSAYILRL